MDLSSFPKSFWPIIATPASPSKIALRSVLLNPEKPLTTQALIFNYQPTKGGTKDASDVLVAELMNALGYTHLPSGSIEGVCQVLSSQLFPTIEQIERHPHDPIPCSVEKYTEMSRLFFHRQFQEQSVAELNWWKTHAEQLLAVHRRNALDMERYARLIPSYYDRTLAMIDNQKAYLPELWDRLVAHFKDVAVVTEVPYVGLRIKSMDKSPFAIKKES